MSLHHCVIHRNSGGTPSVKPKTLVHVENNDRNSVATYTADKDMLVFAKAISTWISGGWGNTEIRLAKGGMYRR